MQRVSVPISVSMYASSPDRNLWQIKTILEENYWAGRDAVYSFQFVTGDTPLTNQRAPLYFHLIRYANVPSEAYATLAGATSVAGVVKNDGSIEYGGSVRGVLDDSIITWSDGSTWSKAAIVPTPQFIPMLPTARELRDAWSQDMYGMSPYITTGYYPTL